MNRIIMFAYNINIMYLHDTNTIFQTKNTYEECSASIGGMGAPLFVYSTIYGVRRICVVKPLNTKYICLETIITSVRNGRTI